jgi:hypothetical protein
MAGDSERGRDAMVPARCTAEDPKAGLHRIPHEMAVISLPSPREASGSGSAPYLFRGGCSRSPPPQL